MSRRRAAEPFEDRARWALAVCLLAVGAPGVVGMWVVEGSGDPVVRWGYPVLLACIFGYAWVLLRRPRVAARASRVGVLGAQAVWIGVIPVRLHQAEDAAAGWAELFPQSFMGITLFCVVGFLYWPTGRATSYGFAAVVLTFVVGTTALLRLDGGTAYVRDLGRFCTYLAVVVVLVHVLSRTKERLVVAVEDAARADAVAVRMRAMAYLDELTGIANRRRLIEELGHQSALVGQDNPVSVVFFDLDHFKQINDTHGHALGDRVLQVVARTAERLVREGDVLTRLGGEEFVLVAPGTGHEQAVQLAERLRALLPEQVALAVDVAVTASFGVTELVHGERPAAVLARVDALMYDAKRGGRDRVVIA